MDDSKRLAYSIIEHLNSQVSQVTGDAAESLEVAIQCLEQVYNIDVSDTSQMQMLKCDKPLQQIFSEAYKSTGTPTTAEPTAEKRMKAEDLKTEGNRLMKDEQYNEAINCYTSALELDGSNPVYLCNRAAAYSKTNEHQKAVDDCERALQLDPLYVKAYGRMGLAYAQLSNFQKSRDCYAKAVEFEPNNDYYKNSLDAAEQKISELQGAQGGQRMPQGLSNLGGLDLGSLLNNPAIMNMAQSFMSNPQMQQMFTNMMAGGTGAGGGGGGGRGMSNLFQASQQFAEQMESSNPELLQQLREQVQNAQTPNPPPETEEDKDEK